MSAKKTFIPPPQAWRTRTSHPLDNPNIARTDQALLSHYGCQFLYVGEYLTTQGGQRCFITTFERNDWGMH
jgi:hypothetical protein